MPGLAQAFHQPEHQRRFSAPANRDIADHDNRHREAKQRQPSPAVEVPAHRDQRAADNWALLAAADLARGSGAPLCVAFALAPTCPGATLRHYDFMLRGLAETEADLRAAHIPLVLLPGDPAAVVPAFLREIGAGACVTVGK